MKVLVLKNVSHEGPGTIEDFLRAKSIQYRIVELSMADKVANGEAYTHLVMMGGPMAVYEMDRYKFLATGADLLKRFIEADKAALGVCLGAQMMAHVLGGRVYPGGQKEIGWYNVDITPEGMRDPVFKCLSVGGRPIAEVFQWHGDTFFLPEGAVRLASSPVYPNQAFRWGRKAYALQFHIEVTPAIIAGWFADEKELDAMAMVEHTEKIYAEYEKRAFAFYEEFFKE
jgi:GMP synthase-like glutamine amidotransferase